MIITLQFDNAMPLYRQLYRHIIVEIKNRNIKAGEKLPSKRSLSAHLKISQNTVETAYQQLAAEGYIKSVPKSGFYVCRLEELPVVSASVHKRKAPELLSSEKPHYQYDFQTNTVDTAFFPFSTWAKISKEIMHDENKELLKATHAQGDYLLRECIAKYLHDFRGVNSLPEQIIIGAGTEYLLGLIVQILGRDSVYSIENPGYQKTYMIINSNGLSIHFISLDEEGLRVDMLEGTDSNVVYITPSHHFPLGIVMPVTRRMQLLKWVNQSSNRYIIEDDYDSEFRFSGRPIPALQGLDKNDKVIYISTFSKSIAPSIRISYMVLPMKLLERYQNNFTFYSSTVSRFEQHSLYRFIKDGHFERHLCRMRNIYKARKDKLVEEIKNMPIGDCIEIIGENAGLHLLFKVNNGMQQQELITRAEEFGVRLYGLSDYYIHPDMNMPRNVLVAGYSNFTEEEIRAAVVQLNKAWLEK